MGKWVFLHPYDAQVHSALAASDVKRAFEVLLQGYQVVVVRYCTTLLANKADGEDLTQEVFVAVLRALARYQPGSETFPSPEDLHQAYVDAKRTQHQLHRLEHSLRQLASDDRALLMMYYYEELSFRSMARRLWKSEATVRRKVHAAE